MNELHAACLPQKRARRGRRGLGLGREGIIPRQSLLSKLRNGWKRPE